VDNAAGYGHHQPNGCHAWCTWLLYGLDSGQTDPEYCLEAVLSIPQLVRVKAKYFDQIGHVPHPKQWLYHESAARFRVAVCGRRFGKSTMAARDVGPLLMTPNTRGWIVGPTYDLGEKEFRVIWDDLMVGKKMAIDKRIRRAYSLKQGNMYIEFPWRSRVEVRSSDHPETLVGERLDWVIVSEAAKQRRETWEKYLQPALADRLGSASFVTTPEGQNWVYNLWRWGQDPAYKNWASWQFPSWLNNHVFPGGEHDDEILRIRSEVTPEWFDQEIGALFTAFVGRIYPEWSEQSHVQTVPYNPAWPNYIAFDWGFANPFAAIEFQVTPTDQIRVWREHYRSFTTLREHIRIMQSRPQPDQYHLELGFADSADPEAVMEMSSLFVPVLAMDDAKNWRQGVETVKRFLKTRDTGKTDDWGAPVLIPGLVVDHSCVNTIREFNNYRAADPPKTDNDPQDKAKKRNDHAMDAIRYALVHLYELGGNRHLEEVIQSNPPPRTNNDWHLSDMAMALSGGDTFFSMATTNWDEAF